VHGALGPAGRARRIQPEGDLVGAGVGGGRQRRAAPASLEVDAAAGRSLPRETISRADFVPALGQRRLQHRQQRRRHQRRLRAAVRSMKA
jgi:hypothetical protein